MTDDLGAQILASVNHMDTKLTAHMADEGKELAEMKHNLDEWRKAAELRHDSLVSSLGSFMEKADVTAAFPRNKNGKPDLDGHCNHHEVLIEEAKTAKERAEDLKRKWLDRAGWALIVFVSFAVWEYIKAHTK